MKGVTGFLCLMASIVLVVSFWWIVPIVAAALMLVGMAHHAHHDLTRKAAPA